MSIDEELARAVEEAEAEVSVPAVAQASEPQAPREGPKKGNWKLLAGLLVMVAGVLTLVLTSGKDSVTYSVGVDKLVHEQARYGDRNVRAMGTLVKGTLVRRDEPCEYRFKLVNNGVVLPVRHPSCDVPDTFRDMPGMDVQVQAEGKLAADGKTFVSNKIIAKCPSKYEMKQRSLAGEMAPHKGEQASALSEYAN